MARRGRRRKVGERTGSGRLKRQAAGLPYPLERAQHGAIMREADERRRAARSYTVAQLVDSHGQIADPFIAIDQLRELAARGRITPEGLAAADGFRRDFRAAYGRSLANSDPARPLVSGKRAAKIPDGALPARHRVERKIAQLGGAEQALGSCAWNVIGLDMSLDDWARRRRWNAGKPLSLVDAEAVLVETVERLAEDQDRAGFRAAE